MKRSVGLYTEIAVATSLLLVAALLFIGFLLVRLTEQELVEQRVESVVGTTEVLARSFFAGRRGPFSPAEHLRDRADALSAALDSVSSMIYWGLVDVDLNPQPLGAAPGGYELDMEELSRVRDSRKTSVRVRFASAWNPFASEEPAFVRVTSAIISQGRFMGALQGQFSLEDVRLRVLTAQRLVFLYTLLYGAVLLLFGAYIINRAVAKPVRQLKDMTGRVAGGDLEQQLPVAGPREIAEVAASFNHMLAALKTSRQETRESIVSLQEANDELRNTRDELITSGKMASVGHLAAGMAHEIGNPLSATIGYLELIKAELEPGRMRQIVKHALDEMERIDRLVRDLLDYAMPSSERPEQRLDLAEVVQESYELLAHQGLFKELSCQVVLNEPLYCSSIARHKLQQVVVNLLLNARDASPTGETIRLSGGQDASRLWLKVSDRGTGIAAEDRDSLFDPFFTTKAPGEGRGLGLSVCHRIIDEAGGHIEVASEEGGGSSFTIWLPGEVGCDDET